MTTRDRLMLMGIVALAVLLGAWFMAISPERERAAKVTAEVQSARQQLQTAETQAAGAHNAQASYSKAYASLVSLGQAVPASAETASLIYTLDRVTHRRDVSFSSITNSSAASGSSSASPTQAGAPSAGFSQQTFTFVFEGSFADLNRLFDQLENFTVLTASGPLRVSGRLLTIDSINLTPSDGNEKSHKSTQLNGTITATAYVLPAGESALGGATPAGPAGATAPSTTTPSASTSSATPATPAVVKVTP
jgi:hypothetical protein